MIGLDTNVLVRYLVEDDEEQALRAAELIEGAADRGDELFLAHIVLCELVWVLGAAYRRSREEIAVALTAILRTAQFVVEDVDLAHRALARFVEERGDFADYLVAERAAEAGCDAVATFDDKLLDAAGFIRP